VWTLRKDSPKTIKYNSGLRVTYFAIANTIHSDRYVLRTSNAQHCFATGLSAGKKKRRRYPGLFDSRSVICAHRDSVAARQEAA